MFSRFVKLLVNQSEPSAVMAMGGGAGGLGLAPGRFSEKTAEKKNHSRLELTGAPKETEYGQMQTTKRAIRIGVLSAKGGCGASTISLNLALALSDAKKGVILVDANFQQPDIAIMIGRQPAHSIVEFITRSHEMDTQVFNACSVSLGRPNCHLMSGPASGDAAMQSNLSSLALALPSLDSSAEYLIVDLPRTLDKHLVTLMDKMDFIVLVFEATVAATAAARRWVNTFAELGYDQKNLVLVQNRAGAKGQECEQSLSELLPKVRSARIPNSYLFAEESNTLGEPALLRNPREKISQAIKHIAEMLGEMSQEKSTKQNAEDRSHG